MKKCLKFIIIMKNDTINQNKNFKEYKKNVILIQIYYIFVLNGDYPSKKNE